MDITSIKKSLSTNEPIQIIFYENDEGINNLINETIKTVIDYYNQPDDYSVVLYGCVKELLINATRANLKRVFFNSQGLDINDMGQYVRGLTLMKGMIETKDYHKYKEALQNADLWVMFNLEHDDNGIRLEVVNNTGIIEIEEKRIRMKLQLAMKYMTLSDMYQKEHDDSEGAGMGIALLVNLLNSAGIDPNLFRIWSKEDTTIARIEIPFTNNYKPLR